MLFTWGKGLFSLLTSPVGGKGVGGSPELFLGVSHSVLLAQCPC